MSDVGSLINTRINLLAVGHPSLVADYRELIKEYGTEPNIYMFHKVDTISYVHEGCIIEKEKIILKVSNNAENYQFTFDLTECFSELYFHKIYFSGEYEFESSGKRIRIHLTNQKYITMDAFDLITNTNYYFFVQEKETYRNRAPIALDTIYVGMAYGKDGSRNAFNRISEHPKLQEIISEAFDENWKEDIVISFWDVNPSIVLGMIGSSGNSEKGMDYINKLFNGPIEEKQLISLTEAGIIYHLQPEYNTLLKRVFPDKNARSYSEIYFREFDGISVEFGLENHDIAIESNDILLTEQNPFIEEKWLDINDKEFFKRMVDGEIN